MRARLMSSKTKSSLFWVGKLSNKILDAYEIMKNAKPKDLIHKNIKTIVDELERHSITLSSTNAGHKATIEALTKLVNFGRKEERESGQNILKIGFPIIEGATNDLKIFRTPLFIWDLIIERSNEKYTLTFGEKQFNSTVIGVHCNSSNVIPILNENISTYDDAILAFKSNKFIKIGEYNQMSKFDSCSKKEFDNSYEPMNFVIRSAALLGTLGNLNTKLFHELTSLIKNNRLEKTLHTEIDRTYDYDEHILNFDENNILHFSKLDIYQQLAIEKAMTSDLVIQGPPGTGKSQVIVNILLNAVAKGKKVLFITEKRTAIDVVYNRLGELRLSALKLYSPKEKKDFFAQFSLLEKYFKSYEVPQKLLIRTTEFLKQTKNKRERNLKIFNNFDRFWTINSEKYKEFESKIVSCDFVDIRFEYIELYDEFVEINRDCKINISIDSINIFNNKKDTLTPTKVDLLYKNMYFFNSPAVPILFRKLSLNKKTIDKKDYDNQLRLRTILLTKFANFKKSDSLYELLKWFVNNGYNEDEAKCFVTLYDFVEKDQSVKIDIKSIFKEMKQNINANIRKLFKELQVGFQKMHGSIGYNGKYFKHEHHDTIEAIIRQSRLVRYKAVFEWFKKNQEILFKIYPLHISTIENFVFYNDLVEEQYDIVIFDEASQIFLEKAIPLLARGKHFVIAGDSKQLKPSLFFENRIDYDKSDIDEYNSEIDEEFVELAEADSLLDYYSTRTNNIMLKGHYRSSFKELIDFSNNHFYDNELLFVQQSRNWHNPIEVIDCNGIWDKGINLGEAHQIVQVVDRLTENNDIYSKTIGIITFNKEQADLIDDLLTTHSNPKISEWMNRTLPNGEYIGLFVKNIENVQGDERDVILFSVAYSPNVRNFGPLSKLHGENRLNVAITRAKEKIIVFKSHKAEDFNINENMAVGAKLFRKWLIYCEDISNLKHINQYSEIPSFDSKFEEQVYSLLVTEFAKDKSNLIHIRTQVKSSKFSIDLVIYNREKPILAIECDGEPFHTSLSQRENDIYRQQLLEERGWEFYRIWYRDWMRNPSDIINKIVQHTYSKLNNL